MKNKQTNIYAQYILNLKLTTITESFPVISVEYKIQEKKNIKHLFKRVQRMYLPVFDSEFARKQQDN